MTQLTSPILKYWRALLSLVLTSCLFCANSVLAGEVEDALLLSSVNELNIRGVERAFRLGAKIPQSQNAKSSSLIYRTILAMQSQAIVVSESRMNEIPKEQRPREYERVQKQVRADAEERALPVLRRLLKEGARHKPSEGVLSIPIRYGAVRVLKILLDNAADPHSRVEGYAPIEMAAMYEQKAAYDLLVSFGVRPMNAIEAAQLHLSRWAELNHIDGMEQALRDGASINGADSCGTTALVAAFSNPFTRDVQIEVIDWFLDKKANLNGTVTGCSEHNGQAPLHTLLAPPMDGRRMPAKSYDLPTAFLVLKLVENGADLATQDREGNTPLHYAVKWNLLEVTRVLLEKGAPLGIANTDGKTPPALIQSKEISDLIRGRKP